MSKIDDDAVIRFVAGRLGLNPSHIEPGSLTIEGIPGAERVTWRGSAFVEPGFCDQAMRVGSTGERNRPAPETVERVLAYLASRPQPVAMSQDDMAGEVGISRTPLATSLRMLVNAGDIAVVRKGSGPGFPTSYMVLRRAGGRS